MGGTIDYYAGTTKTLDDMEVATRIGRYVDSFTETKGHHGYTSCWAGQGVRIYFNGKVGMGVYIQVSGEGCSRIMSHSSFQSWGDEISQLRELGIKETRIDFAFDDRSGLLDKNEIERKTLAGEYTSRYTRFRPCPSYTSGKMEQWTLRYGNTDSRSCLVLYDKRLERMNAGEKDPGPWIRAELRYHQEGAVQAANWVVENSDLNGMEAFLAGALSFKDPSEAAQKSRWGEAKWWSDFLGECGKAHVHCPRVVKSVEARAVRFAQQCSATLAMLVLCYCEGVLYGPWLKNLLAYGWGRMSKEQCQVVSDCLGYKVTQGPLLPWERAMKT